MVAAGSIRLVVVVAVLVGGGGGGVAAAGTASIPRTRNIQAQLPS